MNQAGQMIITGNNIVKKFVQEFPDADDAIKALRLEINKVAWENSNQLKEQYKSASIVGKGCVVFNICGNKYRLVVKIDFISQIAKIRWAGRHKEYDKLRLKETGCLSSK
jgi:mRNA interferase HigB